MALRSVEYFSEVEKVNHCMCSVNNVYLHHLSQLITPVLSFNNGEKPLTKKGF